MPSQLQVLTARIAAAYVSNARMPPGAIPALLASIHDALAGLGKAADRPAALTPAVPPKRSVFPDYIICLEDGRQFKMLKRHLRSTYNMTPDQYRARWNLPADYPMVAPNFGLYRARLARKHGLGRNPAPAETAPGILKDAVARVPVAHRGRQRKT